MSPSGFPDYPTSLMCYKHLALLQIYVLISTCHGFFFRIRGFYSFTSEYNKYCLTDKLNIMSGSDFNEDEIQRLRDRRKAEIMNEIEKKKNPGVIVVDELNFRDFISENRFAVLDMWAEWCGPCMRVAPVIEEFAREYSGRIAFGKCNTDENQSIAAAFSISAIPTLLFFSEGKLINRVTGAYPKEALDRYIKSTFPGLK